MIILFLRFEKKKAKIFLWQITAFADVHSLTIPEVFDEDSGNYTVKASNVVGEATCACKLSVEPVPEEETIQKKTATRREQIPHSPPEFKRLFQDINANPGESVTFECEVNGSPKPKVFHNYDISLLFVMHTETFNH